MMIRKVSIKLHDLHLLNSYSDTFLLFVCIFLYRKVPKFPDARKLCCYLPKIQTKKPNLTVFHQKDANGIANSVYPHKTAPKGAV